MAVYGATLYGQSIYGATGGGGTQSTIITLAQAKDVLNIPAATTKYDTELTGYLDAVASTVEDIAGDCSTGRTYVEQYDGGTTTILLRHRPVLSVTSVVEYWGSYAWTLGFAADPSQAGQYSYTVDTTTGMIVRRTPSGAATQFAGGVSNIWVTYSSGRATVPANVTLAAKELLRHLWQMSQNGGRMPAGYGGEDIVFTPSGYLVPRHVEQLARSGSQRIPGVA